jgi:hypothetical protein
MLQLSEIALNLGFLSVKFKVEELDQTLTSLVNEMRSITSTLQEPEREVLRRIMNNPSEPLTVSHLFPGFVRESYEHNSLRKLRDAQFIRPQGGGRWEGRKIVEVKQFGKLMWEKIGEKTLFSV